MRAGVTSSRWLLTAVAALAALLLGLAIGAGAAASRPPALRQLGCIANRGAWGCTDPRHDSLAAASAIAVSPDGRSVYVAAGERAEARQRGDAVTAFARSGSGELRQLGCLADFGIDGCEGVLPNSLAGADGIAVSPDGRDVYVVSVGGGPGRPGRPAALSEFEREPDGGLIFLGCLAADTATGCQAFPDRGPLEGWRPVSIALAPDGSAVYVSSVEFGYASGLGPSALTRLDRGTDGTLSFGGCISAGGVGGCDPAPPEWSFGDLAAAADGRDLYSLGLGGVEELAPQAVGAPVPVACVVGRGAGLPGEQCSAGPAGLGFATTVATAPDEDALYVLGLDSMTELRRAADGRLSVASCLSYETDGAPVNPGCRTTPRNEVGGSAIVVAPGGRVYTAASGSIAAFGHAASGQLVELGCIVDTGRQGRILRPDCAHTIHPSLRGADGLAVAPGGTDVYVAALSGLSVSWLRAAPSGPAG